MNKAKGFFALLICAVAFGTFGIYIRLLSRDFSNYQQIAFRNIVGLIVASMIIILTKQSFSSIKNVSPRYIILYGLSFPIAVVFFTLSILQTKIITTIFALYIGSLLTSLVIGILAFKEKVTQTKILSLLLAFAGLMVYAYPFTNTQIFNMGFIFGLLSGVVDTTSNSFRKYLAGKVDRFVLVTLQMIGGGLIALLLMQQTGQLFVTYISATSWIVGLLFGLSLVGVSFLTLIGFQNFDLNLGTIILSSELFFATIFAFLFFHEKPTVTELIGGLLIILAIAAVNIEMTRRTPSS